MPHNIAFKGTRLGEAFLGSRVSPAQGRCSGFIIGVPLNLTLEAYADQATRPFDVFTGGQCFFCKQQLPKAEASVEHLFAKANGGDNNDENCVACCKAVNALLGSMSLKEKIQVVLNQKGQFKCPNGAGTGKAVPKTKEKPATSPAHNPSSDHFTLVVANLKQRSHSRPRKLKTLSSTIASLFPKGITEAELNALIQQLQESGKVTVTDNNVTYSL